MKLSLYLAFLCLVPLSLMSQERAQWQEGSSYELVYKLSLAEASKLVQSLTIEIDDFNLQERVPFDTIPSGNRGKHLNELGFYLRVKAKKQQLVAELDLVQNYEVEMVPNRKRLAFIVLKNGNEVVRPEEVVLRGKTVAFDQDLQAYNTRVRRGRGVIVIDNHGEQALFPIHKSYKQFFYRFGNKVLHSFPVKVIYKPGREIYQSIAYGEPTGIVRKAGSLIFRDLREKRVYGYLLLNKPKYEPVDTIRYKVKLAKQNGRAYSRKVTVSLPSRKGKGYQKEIRLKRGQAHGEIVLHDSLNLILDGYQYLAIRRNDQELISTSFDYEEYVLKSEVYDLRLEQEKHNNGEENKAILSGIDENDNNLKNSRYELEIFLKSVEKNRLAPQQHIAHLLFEKSGKIAATGDTEIILPDSIFPKASLQYEVKVAFKNAANDRIEKSATASFFYDKPQISMSIKADSVEFAFPASYTGDLSLRITASPAIKEQTITETDTKTVTLKLNPSVSFYRVYDGAGNLLETFQMSQKNAGTTHRYNRTADSLKLSVTNTTKIPLWYTLYREKRVIREGYTETGVDIALKAKNKESYLMHYRYLWAGEIKTKEFEMDQYDRMLNISVEQQSLIIPGVTDSIRVKVTDYKNRPVANVDIAVASITSKFKRDNIPDVPYFGLSGSLGISHRNFDQPYGYNQIYGNRLKMPYWQKALRLDTVLYYQITRPEDLAILYLDSPDNQTQFAAFATDNGEMDDIYYMKLDDRLVYVANRDVETPFSFKATAGLHSIQIRTYSELIEIDSIYFKKDKKTIVSLPKKPSDSRISRQKASSNDYRYPLTLPEKKQMARQTLQIQTSSWQNLTIQQGDRAFYVKGNYPNQKSVGPIYEDSVSIITDTKVLRLLFEPGYIYQVTDQQIFKKEVSSGNMSFTYSDDFGLFDFLPPENSKAARNAPADEEVLIPYKLDLNDLNLKETEGVLSIYPPEEKRELLKAAYIRPFKSNTAFTKLNRYFTAVLDSGVYELIIAYSDSTIIKEKVKIRAKNSTLIAPELSKLMPLGIGMEVLLYDKVPEKETISPMVLTIPTAKPNLTGFVSGTITGADDGLPLPQASVFLKGTTTGVLTDRNGNFRLSIPNSRGVLVVRYVGYITQEIEVTNQATVNIQLSPDLQSLGEVVVTGYGVTSGVKNNFEPTNLSGMLQGKLAGVYVSRSSGAPGNTSVIIRGVSSLNSGQPLLYVVDGVVVSSMDNIPEQLISNISVLKGASATAIYGAQGANGVVLITTKNGPSNQSQINTAPDFDQGSSASSIRHNFRDYGFWVPTAKTNKQGEVTLVVTYPDDITAWKNHFLAMTNNGKTGQLETTTKAFKPISARLSIPRFLVAGDSSTIYGEVSNFTGDSSLVDRKFILDEKAFNLGSTPVTQGHVDSLKIFAAGIDSLEVSYLFEAKTGGDGERRILPIMKKGIEQTKGVFYSLENDTTLFLEPEQGLGKPTLTIVSDLRSLMLQDISALHRYGYWCNEQKASKLIALLAEKQLLDKTENHFRKNGEIKRLLRKIRKSEAIDGGWGWWQNMEPSFWVSNHVIKALLMAQLSGYDTKTALRESTGYLTEKLPLLRSTELIETMHVLLDVDSSLTLGQYLPIIAAEKRLSNVHKIQLMHLKHRLGEPVSVDSLMSYRQKSVHGGIFFKGSERDFRRGDLMTTIAAYEFLKALGAYDHELAQIREYLMLSRGNGVQRNTYEAANIIRTIGADLDSADLTPKVLVNGSTIETFPYQMNMSDYSPITVEQSSQTHSYLSLSQNFWNAEPLRSDSLGTIHTRFTNEKGQEIDSLSKGEFATLKVRIEVTEQQSFALLEVPIPAGTLYTDKPQSFGRNQYREYFKDKVSFYFESLSPGVHEFEIPLVSQFAGSFTLNPAKLALMYSPLLQSNNGLKRVVIR